MGIRSKRHYNYNINGWNALVVRLESDDSVLDFIEFVETDGKVTGYRLSSGTGDIFPLRSLLVETPTKSFTFKALRKTKLSEKICNIYGETDNYFIVES
jgi:hypothetical protein